MQSVMSRIGAGHGTRAVVYDAKRDMLPILSGMGIPVSQVHVMNPFDRRSTAWDMARDITSPASAYQLAHILIPEKSGESQSYFPDTARRILTGVITAFIKGHPGAWTFRDVVMTCQHTELLREVLSSVQETESLLEEFDTGLTFKSVKSTLDTRMKPYEIIAALWDRAGECISLRDWLGDESVLVLGNDEALRSSLDALNQVVFKRIVELVLSQTDCSQRETWFFLDEVKEFGKLPGLSRLLTQGRSKGACCVLGFQDMEGLQEVYGRHLAYEMVGQCSNKAILRLESPETAEWSSRLFGTFDVEQRNTSVVLGEKQFSNNTSISTVNVHSVLPSEFLDIPPTTPETGLTGFYLVPHIGGYRHCYSGRTLSRELKPLDSTVRDLEPREEREQYLASVGPSSVTDRRQPIQLPRRNG
jgi:type IV secretory pathway TraG/TraD family ATPase VirD4